MNSNDWGREDRFDDSSGKMQARILSWSGGEVHFEYWMKKTPKRTKRHSLPEKFWMSKSCGWQLADRRAGLEDKGE